MKSSAEKNVTILAWIVFGVLLVLLAATLIYKRLPENVARAGVADFLNEAISVFETRDCNRAWTLFSPLLKHNEGWDFDTHAANCAEQGLQGDTNELTLLLRYMKGIEPVFSNNRTHATFTPPEELDFGPSGPLKLIKFEGKWYLSD